MVGEGYWAATQPYFCWWRVPYTRAADAYRRPCAGLTLLSCSAAFALTRGFDGDIARFDPRYAMRVGGWMRISA